MTFDNNSNNPVAGSRVIQVTVNDGFMNSNVATTTVNVVAVNDAPNASNDIDHHEHRERPDRGPGMGAAVERHAIPTVRRWTSPPSATPTASATCRWRPIPAP